MKNVTLFLNSVNGYFLDVPVVSQTGEYVVLNVSDKQFVTENFPFGVGDCNKQIVARMNIKGDLAIA